jgi:hypothetical protein
MTSQDRAAVEGTWSLQVVPHGCRVVYGRAERAHGIAACWYMQPSRADELVSPAYQETSVGG